MLNSYWQSLYSKSQSQKLGEEHQAPLKLNEVLTQSALVQSANACWLPSPAKGVRRLMLERDGGEKTLRATSIVAYEPGSQFSSHSHPLGEEFLVLSGTFSDEHGDYPTGTYVRNPPGSSHSPFSKEGCLIWVKLQQFQPEDARSVVISIPDSPDEFGSDKNNILSFELFSDYEQVNYEQAIADTTLHFETTHQGIEILLLEGSMIYADKTIETGTWLRLPKGEAATIGATEKSKWLIKTGHLV